MTRIRLRSTPSKLVHLFRGEVRNRNDQVRASSRFSCLLGKTPPELGRRIFGGHHEEIVKSGDHSFRAGRRSTLWFSA